MGTLMVRENGEKHFSSPFSFLQLIGSLIVTQVPRVNRTGETSGQVPNILRKSILLSDQKNCPTSCTDKS